MCRSERQGCALLQRGIPNGGSAAQPRCCPQGPGRRESASGCIRWACCRPYADRQWSGIFLSFRWRTLAADGYHTNTTPTKGHVRTSLLRVGPRLDLELVAEGTTPCQSGVTVTVQ